MCRRHCSARNQRGVLPEVTTVFFDSYWNEIILNVYRLKAKGTDAVSRTSWVEPPRKTVALSSTRMKIYDPSSREFEEEPCGYASSTASALPLFVSSCPGWICFAEKTYPQVIPYLSTTKSPQQILGALLKKVFPGVLKERLHHSSSMR